MTRRPLRSQAINLGRDASHDCADRSLVRRASSVVWSVDDLRENLTACGVEVDDEVMRRLSTL